MQESHTKRHKSKKEHRKSSKRHSHSKSRRSGEEKSKRKSGERSSRRKSRHEVDKISTAKGKETTSEGGLKAENSDNWKDGTWERDQSPEKTL